MNISQDVSTALPLAPPIQATVAGKAGGGKVLSPSTPAEDQAHWSEAASLAREAAAAPDVRHEKIAAVQAALTNGTYEVPSSEVAQSLVDHMLGKKA